MRPNDKTTYKARRLEFGLAVLGMSLVVGLGACNKLPGGSALIVHADDPNLAAIKKDEGTATNMRTAIHVQALAIGQQVIAALGDDLTSVGLTSEQAGIVTSSAEQSLNSHVGTLAVGEGEFALSSSADDAFDPIVVATPAIIAGAMAALDEPNVGLSHATGRSNYTQTILSSTFGSLQGRTSSLEEASLALLSKDMVGHAVASLSDAGLTEDSAVAATQAITSGAMSSLTKAGFSGDTVANAAKAVVEGAVENLASVNFGSDSAKSKDLMSKAVGSAASGAIASINTAGLGDAASVSLVGDLTASTMSSLGALQKTLKNSSLDLEATVKQVSTGAVGALKGTKLIGQAMGAGLQSITSSMVGALGNAGFDKGSLAKGAGAVASGALEGMSATGLSEKDVTDQGLVKDVMAGTIKNLGAINLTPIERASAMGEIVGQAVSSLAGSVIKSAENKQTAISSVLEGTIANFKMAGLDDSSVFQLAVTNVSKGATQALPAAGISNDQLGSTSGMIAKTSINMIVDAKLNTGTEDFKAMSSKVTQGVMEGFGALAAAGTVSSSEVAACANRVINDAINAVAQVKDSASVSLLQTSQLGDFSSSLVGSAFTGLATSGVEGTAITAMQSTVTSTAVSNLRDRGVAESTLSTMATEIQTQTTKATTLATAIANFETSYPVCSEGYPDSTSDEAFFAQAYASQVYCRTAIQAECPKARSSTQLNIQWLASDIAPRTDSKTPYLCQLVQQVKEALAPGSFAFTMQDGRTFNSLPLVTWDAASTATGYTLTLATDKDCANTVAKLDTTQTQLSAPALSDGSYFACLDAINAFNKVTRASNSPLAFTLDRSGPSSPLLSVASADVNGMTTSLQVTLSLSAQGASQMFITNTAGCAAGGTWEAYATTKNSWSLAQANMLNTVYARFVDELGNLSDCVSASVTHNSLVSGGGVTIGNANPAYTASPSMTLYLTATNATQMYITNSMGCSSGGIWEGFNATKAGWALAQTNASTSVYVKYKNDHGPETSCFTDTIIHDDVAPSGASIVIAGGAPRTSVSSVSLALNAVGATEMYITNTAGCASGGSWETYAASKTGWTLATLNSSNQVYVAFRDAAHNVTSCTYDSIIHDNTAPTVTGVTSTTSSGSYALGATINVTLAFSEAVTISGGPTITLETGATDRTVSCTGSSPTTTMRCTYTVSAGDASPDLNYQSTAALALNGGTIADATGNALVLTLPALASGTSLGQANIVIDTTAPSVSSVSATTANGAYKVGSPNIDLTVTFTELVTVTGNPTLTLETGASDGQAICQPVAASSTMNCSYTIAAGDVSADLNYESTTALALNGGSITDGANNPADLTLPGLAHANALGTLKAIVIDNQAPTISSVNAAAGYNGYQGDGSTIPIQVNFSEPVLVTGTPTIDLMVGATYTVNCDNSGGSHVSTITCSYTVQQGHTIADLNHSGSMLGLTGGATIRDQALNDASLALPTPPNTLADNNAIVIALRPALAGGIISSSVAPYLREGDALDIDVPFSEVVAVTGTPRLKLETGATDTYALYLSGSNTASLTFRYTVEADDNSSDLDYMATNALALNGGTIRSMATQLDANLTLPAPGSSGSLGFNENYIVDTIAPSATITFTDDYNSGSPLQLDITTGDSDIQSRDIYSNSACSTFIQTLSVSPPYYWNSGIPGTQTVTAYVKLMDYAGNASSCIAAAPAVLRRPHVPSISDDGHHTPNMNQAPPVGWVAAANSLGVAHYEVAVGPFNGALDGNLVWTIVPGGISPTLPFTPPNVTTNFTQGGHYVTSIRACDSLYICSDPVSGDGFYHGLKFTHYVKAETADATDNFGGGVASLTNAGTDFIAVGAPLEDSNGTTIVSNGVTVDANNLNSASGAVYLYKRGANDATWVREAYVKAPNNVLVSSLPVVYNFGETIAMSYSPDADEELMAVAVKREASNSTGFTLSPLANRDNLESGAVYLYKRSGTDSGFWDFEGQIKDENAGTQDAFGTAIALDGDTLVVSNTDDDASTIITQDASVPTDDNDAIDAGAVFVYRRASGNWNLEAHVKAVDAVAGDKFGSSVDIIENFSSYGFMAVGAPYQDTGYTDRGKVYTYQRSGTTWSAVGEVHPTPGAANQYFGHAVAFGVINAELFLAVAAQETDSQQGTVFVYKWNGASWNTPLVLVASNARPSSYFGSSIAFAGNKLVVGAYGESHDGTAIMIGQPTTAGTNTFATLSGGVYYFSWDGASFIQDALIKAPNAESSDLFGKSISASGSFIVVGASQEDNSSTIGVYNGTGFPDDGAASNSGAVYIYKH